MLKVSVLMLVYNHERFISQAIESALMQATDFEYEIIIGEDCSKDDTRRIVVDYELRYPEKIRALLRERNLGMIPNFIESLKECKGQYIAILEGDDFWISADKLQRQVHFLDSDPECAICFSSARVISDNDSFQSYVIPPSEYNKDRYKLEDILKGNFIPTCSVMFRNGLIKEFPQWFYGQQMGDWPLHVLNAQYGAIGYIRDVTAVYRLHSAGNFSARATNQNMAAVIAAYEVFDAFFHYKYHKVINDAIIHARLFGVKCHLRNREYAEFLKSSLDLLWRHNAAVLRFVYRRFVNALNHRKESQVEA
jgi:glycosyltransferase involved in cell wall biosynthesis